MRTQENSAPQSSIKDDNLPRRSAKYKPDKGKYTVKEETDINDAYFTMDPTPPPKYANEPLLLYPDTPHPEEEARKASKEDTSHAYKGHESLKDERTHAPTPARHSTRTLDCALRHKRKTKKDSRHSLTSRTMHKNVRYSVTQGGKIKKMNFDGTDKSFVSIRALAQYIGVNVRPDVAAAG